jgi:hypothetical protein
VRGGGGTRSRASRVPYCSDNAHMGGDGGSLNGGEGCSQGGRSDTGTDRSNNNYVDGSERPDWG